MSRNRRAFTLTELLVVIGILLTLSALTFAVFGTGKSSDKMRSGARSAQSAFLGAKDRALHAKDLRGVRLTHDQTNFNLVNGFAYIWTPSVDPTNPGVLSYPPGSFQMERLDLTTTGTGNPPPDGQPDSADVLVLHGFDGTEGGPPSVPYVDWAQKSQFFASPGKIRIPSGSGGQWFAFTVATSGKYALGAGNEYVILQTAYPGAATVPYVSGDPTTLVAFPRFPAGNIGSCDIKLGNDVLPFHEPITLPSGCIIDLKFSQIPPSWTTSVSVQPAAVSVSQQQGWAIVGPDPKIVGNTLMVPPMDVMFSPRGNLAGAIGAMGAMFFCIRDIRDATNGINPAVLFQSFGQANVPTGWTVLRPDPSAPGNVLAQPNPQGDCLILAVFPQTGYVQTYDLDLTDNLTNGTNAGPPDGLADNVFNFAQRGMSAGK